MAEQHATHSPQYDEDTSAFLAERVADRYFDIIESHERCACSWGVCSLDRFRTYAVLALDEDDREAVL